MDAFPPSQKDSPQVLKYAFNDETQSLRVEVTNASPTPMSLNHTSDSVAIGTPTVLFTSTGIDTKLGLDVNVINPITVDTTGLATSDNQLTEISELTNISTSTSSIDSKLNSLGQKISADSVPVVIASDQSVPVSGPITNTELRAEPVVTAGTFNTVAPTLTDTQSAALQLTDRGSLIVAGFVGIVGDVTVDQGTNPWVVSGSVTANAGTDLNTSALALDATLTNSTQKTQLVSATGNAAAVQTLGTAPTSSDFGVLTNSLLYGLTTGGGGGYVPVKVTPSGTITADVSGSTVNVTQNTSPWIISGSVVGPLTDTQLRASPVPVSGTVTANAGVNLNTSALALDSTVAKDASLTTINTSVNTLLKPSNTLAAVTTLGTITNVVHVDDNSGSLTVDNNGTFAVQATLSAETTKVIGAVNQGTSPWAVSGTVTTIPSGTQNVNVLSSVEVEVKNDTGNPVPVSGTVTANAGTGTFSVIENINTGRNQTNYFMNIPVVTTATDTLVSLTGFKGGAAVAPTTTPAVVTSGKTYRITSITIDYVSIAAAGSAKFTLRANPAGVVAITSPAVLTLIQGTPAAVAGAGNTYCFSIPEGMEFAAGTGIGISLQGLSSTQVAAAVGYGHIGIHGYEY